MKKDILVPSAGESVKEADIASWNKQNGDFVQRDEVLLTLETDKASLDITADISGVLTIAKPQGTVKVGETIGFITESKEQPAPPTPSAPPQKETVSSAPVPAVHSKSSSAAGYPSPAAAKLMAEKNIPVASIVPSGKNGRVTKTDVLEAIQKPAEGAETISPREISREKMTRLRRTIAQRLVQAQQTAALLTTFNEIDMSAVMDVRKKYKQSFQDKFNVGLGFMSFFTKAVCLALKQFPMINACVQEEEIVYHRYCDIGIAVATPKGLVVPIIRNAEKLSFHEIEAAIGAYAVKAKEGKLALEDLEGGTFSITNGGVFGSMLSTPILNPPQSAILGMHTIVERPVAVNGQVVIRPIMYAALTYDHRIIDGADAVRFLVSIKTLIEDPVRVLIEV